MDYVVSELYSRQCALKVMGKCILGSPAKVFKLLENSNQEYMQEAIVCYGIPATCDVDYIRKNVNECLACFELGWVCRRRS